MNFIILGCNNQNIKKYESIISESLLSSKLEYHSYKFNDINNMKEYAENNKTKNIYIIENNQTINTESIVDYIRKEKNDYQSYIIIINFDKNFKLSRYNIMTTIIESNNMPTNLMITIKELKNMYLQDSNMFYFKQNGVLFLVPLSDIVCIEKLQNSKYTQITCKNRKYVIKETLNNIKTRLNKNFIMVHRSVFVNIKEIKTYDHVNGIISFTNHHQTSMISRDKKKELLKVLTEQDIISTKQGTK
jgi:DNA-binding LytR/AlgR family response regulator